VEGDRFWIEDSGVEADASTITVGPRVGVDYAGVDARKPYRFFAKF
jgi:DNA-3-methyladenine glycosylase